VDKVILTAGCHCQSCCSFVTVVVVVVVVTVNIALCLFV